MTRAIPVASLPANVCPSGRALSAIELDEGRGYVILIEAPDGSTREYEYAARVGRLLTREERLAALPPDGPYPLPAFSDLRAIARHRLDAHSDARIIEVDVTDLGGAPVSALRALVYTPRGPGIETAIQRALDQRRFPETYQRWSDAERVAHWAHQLHRWRRARGESGQAEDGIFTPDLLADMRGLDPDVDRLIPEILVRAATLGGEPGSELLAAFVRGTGWRS